MEEGNRTFRVNFTADGVSKLREAVDEKLKEFMGDYTDDTLVEYVIVLLKNGRSKDEARSELNVFLGDDDSDSFVSWLWDHLGSSLSLYVQPPEPHPDGPPKSKLKTEDEAGNAKSRQFEPETEKLNSVKAHGHHKIRRPKWLVKDVNETDIPTSRMSVADNEISQDESHRRVGRTKPSLSPRATIHKKRMPTEEQHERKRVLSQSTVCAPRRLLQFAVRDALAASRPSNAASVTSRKRLRSVVSTSVGDLLQEEQHPQRIRRTSMSAAIKASAEAVMDVNKARPLPSVFNRIGHATDVSNPIHQEHGPVVEDVDFSWRQERHVLPFNDNVLDSVLGYDDDGGYDDIDEMERDAADVYLDNSLTVQYDHGAVAGGDNIDGRLLRLSRDLGPPAIGHNASRRIASSVSMNNTRISQYQDEMDVSQMDNRKTVLGSGVATDSDVRLMRENSNPTLAFNGNAKYDAIQQPEKTQTLTGLENTGPPTGDADSRTIFVSNVHFAATKDSLSRHFNKFGEVLKVIILTDPVTRQPKGSAYLEFMRTESAELALSSDGTSFMSRLLKVVRKNSAQTEATLVTTQPHIPRASSFSVPRFGRAPPFPRGLPNIYRARGPLKPGPKRFQWKRGTEPTNSFFPTPSRGLTYIRTEANKTNGSSGTPQ